MKESPKKRFFFKGNFLDIGCGRMPYKTIIEQSKKLEKYIGLDIINPTYQSEIKPDLFWDGEHIPMENSTIDSAMLIEVLEHVPSPQTVLQEIRRVMNKDGVLLITVPFLWPLHDVPHDEYRYTPFSLERLLNQSDFEVLEMEALGGWNASLGTMLSLYVKRYLGGRKQRIALFFLKPIIKWLFKRDKKNDHSTFRESSMITGLWCLAKAK